MAARKSVRGYLGLLFTGCLFLFGFCLRGLNSVTKASHRGKDHEKELMFKGLKFAVVAFASKGLSPPRPFPPFFESGFLMSEGSEQHRSGIFVKLQGGRGEKKSFESSETKYPTGVCLRLACS